MPLLNEILGARPADEWLARLDKAGVPAGRIKSVAEVCESAHLRARGMMVSLPHPKAGADHGDGRAGSPARHAGRGLGCRPRCWASTPTRS